MQWTKALADYPASAGWVLTYHLRGVSSLDVKATPAGDEYAIVIAASASAKLLPGAYEWKARVTKEELAHTVGAGRLMVDPDLAIAGARQSHAERCLAILEAKIEKRVVDDVAFYQLLGRSAQKTPLKDLMRLRNFYAAKVARERGGRFSRAVGVRFVRPA